MPRQRLTEEEKKANRIETNRKYYENKRLKKAEDGEDGRNYKDYLSDMGKKQLKLTISSEEDAALREYCAAHDIKPQEFVRNLIREALSAQ